MTLHSVLLNEAIKLRDSSDGIDEWRTVITDCGIFDIHILLTNNRDAFDVAAYPVNISNGHFNTDTSVWFNLGQIEASEL